MDNILEKIIKQKRVDVEHRKQNVSQSMLDLYVKEKIAQDGLKPRSMRASLENSKTGIISEFKRKSPSKGWINEEASLDNIIEYDKAGAAAISVLTDYAFFGGMPGFIRTVRPYVSAPILRKDFIVDEYMIYEAKVIGADAILLIAAALEKNQCEDYRRLAHELGLEVLLEVHSKEELEYANDDTDMIGVNNRQLSTFKTDVQLSFDMVKLLPKGATWVSESGISNAQVVKDLRSVGYRGFLIGETFMREEVPSKALKNFINELEK